MKTMKIKGSYIASAVIMILIGAWILSGYVGADETQTPTTADQAQALMQVRTIDSVAREHAADIVIRGRTQASRSVVLRAETSGQVEAVPVAEGSFVQEGEVICQLALASRQAKFEQAKAKANQAKLEYEASKELFANGHRSETQLAASESDYKAAEAALDEIQLDIDHTKIKAPFDGILEDRNVEVGDYMQTGGECGTVVDHSPMLVVGQVSEKEVMNLSVGEPGRVKLFSGQELDGTVRFIGSRANEDTRTFRVELELPNEDASLREGVTAEITISGRPQKVHFVSPAILTLNDKGEIGVKIVKSDQTVDFVPVKIIADNANGVWISGLPDKAQIIVVGQEYVSVGQKVDPHPQTESLNSRANS